MENTLENKEKFFAQYYGQTVQVDNDLEGKYPLTIGNISFKPEKCHLVLKSLLSITDEDARGVIKILRVELHSESEIQFVHNSIKTYINKGYKGIDSHILDYLRSKGYALPYMGLSVEKQIEYGWINLV